MKNLSIGLNVVLIIAVAVLYFFQFSDKPIVDEKKAAEDTVQTATADEYPVAYVNIDTLISEYDFYIAKRDALMQRRDESEAELQSETQKLEREFADFQNKNGKIKGARIPKKSESEFDSLFYLLMGAAPVGLFKLLTTGFEYIR